MHEARQRGQVRESKKRTWKTFHEICARKLKNATRAQTRNLARVGPDADGDEDDDDDDDDGGENYDDDDGHDNEYEQRCDSEKLDIQLGDGLSASCSLVYCDNVTIAMLNTSRKMTPSSIFYFTHSGKGC